MSHFAYGNEELTLQKVLDLATGEIQGKITEEIEWLLQTSRDRVDAMAESEKPIYGINTGFGPLCDTRISATETCQLQQNLLLSHAVGVGHPIAAHLSKIMLLCKIHALCQGYSGVRKAVVERLVYFVDHEILPVVPEQGSVGASGDLAPLSHLFLPLIGFGICWQGNEIVSAQQVLHQHQLHPITLQAKEGLALINGTQFILAHAIIGLDKMKYLLDLADLAGAMTIEGCQGSAAPFSAVIHRLRPFEGSLKVAARMRQFLGGSQNIASHASCERVQDPYSLRCIPQVHGASRNAFHHLSELVEIEMNAVTDNPVVVGDAEAISGGNFHGQPLALALDYCAVAAAELGNISDRRCFFALSGQHGLPRFLTRQGGLHSGLMVPQYVTAALVTENKSLCFPASADSVPTSLGQEDHVSMGSISGRRFNQILDNLQQIIAIELMLGAQAMELRRPNTFSTVLEENLAIIREVVPSLDGDRLFKKDIDAITNLVKNRKLNVLNKI